MSALCLRSTQVRTGAKKPTVTAKINKILTRVMAKSTHMVIP